MVSWICVLFECKNNQNEHNRLTYTIAHLYAFPSLFHPLPLILPTLIRVQKNKQKVDHKFAVFFLYYAQCCVSILIDFLI